MPSAQFTHTEISHAIGGYFGLELRQGSEFYPDARKLQSGRSAFLLLLQTLRPRRIWMPRYICDSMLEPLHISSTPFEFYDLTPEFGIAPDIELAPRDLLLYANYFGLQGSYLPELRTRFPADRLILDNTQAFYADPEDCLAAIYSPRKFFGVPDGGYLATAVEVEAPAAAPAFLPARLSHLLKRLAGDAEDGYADFQAAERAFSGQLPQAMSPLTRRLLSSIDYASARRRRLDNFSCLHRHLAQLGQKPVPEPADGDVPLCYPFLARNDKLRTALSRARIYTPVYWRDVDVRSHADSVERMWAERLVLLPVDQRYTEAEMLRIVDVVSSASR
jgi:hypothetical protein